MGMYTIREQDEIYAVVLAMNSIAKIERTGAKTFKYHGNYTRDIEKSIMKKLRQHKPVIDSNNDTGDCIVYTSDVGEYSILIRDFNNIISIEIINNHKEEQ